LQVTVAEAIPTTGLTVEDRGALRDRTRAVSRGFAPRALTLPRDAA